MPQEDRKILCHDEDVVQVDYKLNSSTAQTNHGWAHQFCEAPRSRQESKGKACEAPGVAFPEEA
ncbi:Hypothetical predicted protein [Pelobates cultripes]|uniref:Uncharacterized protein n=1 Tax=Pelobates cultripes TaxID=61616 RepID=A0AAD1T5Q4_PELCU|nr:Hypothetical predicted protein [Pelobates cultripes]